MIRKILVIAPHADDEVLGCGGTIKKKASEGDEVYVLVMTNAHVGAPELFSEDLINCVRGEALEAHSLLGVKQTVFFDFPAPALDQYPSYKMSSKIMEVLREFSIDTVYLPHNGDIHKDHQMVFDAGLVACRPNVDRGVKRIYVYETVSETEWGIPRASSAFIPVLFETLSEDDFEFKLSAMKCFESQLKNFPASRSLETIEALAKVRGATINTSRAEAFMIIREIQD